MEFLAVSILTFFSFIAIIKIAKKRVFLKKISYRQSDIHHIVKNIFVENIKNKKVESQLTTRIRNNTVNMLSMDNKVYWVVDNIFYVTDIINDLPDVSNAKQVDTLNMSKEDVDKMLFILDNLTGGNNERGGTRY